VQEHQKKIDQIIGKAKHQVAQGHANRLGNSDFEAGKVSIGSIKGGAKGLSNASPAKNLPDINQNDTLGSRGQEHYASNTSIMEDGKRRVPYPAAV